MAALLEQLQLVDRLAIQASEGVRWGPLTVVFVLASASWVKAPVFVAVGALGDVRARRTLPLASALALLAALAGSVLAFLLKEAVDRARPPLAGHIDPLVATPDSPSFPSGHAATAFAAATVVAAFHPRLRLPMYALAAFVALSRVYLGVHYWLDIIAGAALGVVVGLLLVRTVRVFAIRLDERQESLP